MIMKIKYFLKQIFILVSSFCSTTIFSQSIVTVTNSSLHGWVKEEQYLGNISFTSGPSKPPLQKGSLEFNAPINGNGRFVRMRNTGYSGLLLSSITQLSYSTFVQKADSKLDAPFIVLQVDADGDATEDTHMVFNLKFQNPKYTKDTGVKWQGPIRKKVWQTWDALHGAWFTGLEKDPEAGAPMYSLSSFISTHPNARIVNDKSGGGVRLQAGGIPMADNFLGNADAFTIGINGQTIVYDFEVGSRDNLKGNTKSTAVAAGVPKAILAPLPKSNDSPGRPPQR